MKWEFPDAPKPISMVFESVDDKGLPMWYMPPNPLGHPCEMLAAYDYLHDEARWLKRTRHGIRGLVPDGQELIVRNMRDNRKLGFEHDWKELWGREEGKTCILCGCGPSLRDSWSEIGITRNHKGFFTLGINNAISMGEFDYYYIMDRRGSDKWYCGNRLKTTLIASTSASVHGTRNRFKERYWCEHFLSDDPTKFTSLNLRMGITFCEAMFLAYKLGAKKILIYGSEFSIPLRHVNGGWLGSQWYCDTPADDGFSIRQHREAYPVRGIGGTPVGAIWEYLCYAAYTTTMAIILTRGGVKVRNRTPLGLLWETWRMYEGEKLGPEAEKAVRRCDSEAADGKHDLCRALRLRPEKVP